MPDWPHRLCMDPALQKLVWLRAESRCEYCQFPTDVALLPFQIDHIIAEKHGGTAVSDNLALSCERCDSHCLDRGRHLPARRLNSRKAIPASASTRWKAGCPKTTPDPGGGTGSVMIRDDSRHVVVRWLSWPATRPAWPGISREFRATWSNCVSM
jgi:hypothetical protein